MFHIIKYLIYLLCTFFCILYGSYIAAYQHRFGFVKIFRAVMLTQVKLSLCILLAYSSSIRNLLMCRFQSCNFYKSTNGLPFTPTESLKVNTIWGHLVDTQLSETICRCLHCGYKHTSIWSYDNWLNIFLKAQIQRNTCAIVIIFGCVFIIIDFQWFYFMP